MVKSFKKYYTPFVISVLLLLVAVVFSILTPSKIRDLTNLISTAGKELITGQPFTVDLESFVKIAIVVVIFIGMAFLGNILSGLILNTAIQRYSRDLRESISHKINRLPLNYYDTKQTGDILSVITNDVDTLATSLQNSITILIQSGAMLIGVIIAMYLSCWQMATVVLASLPVMLILLFATFRVSIPLFNKNQSTLGEVNAMVEENYSGHIVIKAFHSEQRKIKEFKKCNGFLGEMLYKSQAVGGLAEPLMMLISYLTYAATLLCGGILFSSGGIADIGVITGFLIYIALFQEPLAQVGQISSTIQMGTAACNRVFQFLEEEELDDESAKKDLLDHNNIKGNVEFKNVSFGYDPAKLTIKSFSEKIKPGMKVAIIGPTGAGKTTLVNLLMRFYEVTGGDIIVDGVSIKDMSRSELRDVFGMILQETWVINGTLRENIVYNLKDISDERLNKILEETNLSHFVSTLPDGIDTVIQKESALSAGQKQLVTIARAMAENAPMLILDEATSNVDTRTEILIQNAMDKLTSGRTSFVIAHRLSTIKNSDLILVMKDGNVVETGDHSSLMAMGGLYSEIYNSQFN